MTNRVQAVYPPPPDRRENAVVLVHGAWVGEYCWDPILQRLERAGRRGHAVSLTGHGARAHHSGPHVTFEDHVDDVVRYVDTYALSNITLVGHSYGGRVITQAWSRLEDRVARMVYLDGHAPLLAEGEYQPAKTLAPAENGMVPFTEYTPDPNEFGGEESVAWFVDRLMPQSAATLGAPFHANLPDALPKTYVFATGDRQSRFSQYAHAARAHPAWRLIELSGSHWVMVSHPEEVTSIILDPSFDPSEGNAR